LGMRTARKPGPDEDGASDCGARTGRSGRSSISLVMRMAWSASVSTRRSVQTWPSTCAWESKGTCPDSAVPFPFFPVHSSSNRHLLSNMCRCWSSWCRPADIALVLALALQHEPLPPLDHLLCGQPPPVSTQDCAPMPLPPRDRHHGHPPAGGARRAQPMGVVRRRRAPRHGRDGAVGGRGGGQVCSRSGEGSGRRGRAGQGQGGDDQLY
jgi:hypothetical protein